MILDSFLDNKLAHVSYLVGCPATSSALVIDPARDITPYLEAAIRHDMTIETVVETHIHADFVSGARELAHATGAQILLSGEGGSEWQYTFPADDDTDFLYDGDTFSVGNVTFEVLHTPGHSPEHLSLLVTDGGADVPYGIFTGDFLFVGGLGRPDLLDLASGTMGTAAGGARQQFENLQRLAALPDYLQIFPAHRSGTACGSATGDMPSSTVGYERRTNPAFQFEDADAFTTWLLDTQETAPQYFAHMKQVNKQGAPLLRELPQAQHLRETPDEDIVPESALFIDTRPIADFAQRHLPGTINIPLETSGFPTYVGYYVDYDLPTFFIAYENDVPAVLKSLFSIGVDNVPAYFTSEVVTKATGSVPYATVQEIQQRHDAGEMIILDVRSQGEYDESHIPDVMHIHMSEILDHLNDLPTDQPIAVQCGAGVRSQVVTSILQTNGFENVINMDGGIDAWKNADLPIESDDD